MSEAKQIFGALARIMTKVGHVGKTRKNPQQGYQFRGIDDVVAACQEVLAAEGVVMVPFVVEREREMLTTKSGGTMASVRLLVDHYFYAADGSSVTARTFGEAMDSGDKASNKAMSAALKYALTEALMIPTYEADRDTEESSPEIAAPAKAPAVVSGKPAVAALKAATQAAGKMRVQVPAKSPPAAAWPPDYQPPEPPPHTDEEAPF
jgi:hypothetical protein